MKKLLILLLGLFLLGALGYICIYHLNLNVKIQEDIDSRTRAALAGKELDEIIINTDGRDIVLKGVVANETIRQQAEQVASNVYGVRIVDNQLMVETTEPVIEPEPIVEQAEAESVVEPETETQPEPEPIEEVVQSPKIEPLPEFTCQQDFDLLLSTGEIRFATNSADIDASSHNLLSDLIEAANKCPESYIEIGGHTDSSGSDDYNLRLSQARAISVMSYLIDNGIDATRLSAVGYGENNPIADNDSEEGMAKNRRIEFNVKVL